MYEGRHECIYVKVCIYGCTYVYMYLCLYVPMYVCICVYIGVVRLRLNKQPAGHLTTVGMRPTAGPLLTMSRPSGLPVLLLREE